MHESVHDALIEKVVARAATIRLGDPTAADTEMGPMANRPQYDKLVGYLQGARSARARPSPAAAQPDPRSVACSSSRRS